MTDLPTAKTPAELIVLLVLLGLAGCERNGFTRLSKVIDAIPAVRERDYRQGYCDGQRDAVADLKADKYNQSTLLACNAWVEEASAKASAALDEAKP